MKRLKFAYIYYLLVFMMVYTTIIVGDNYIFTNDLKLEKAAINRIQDKLEANEIRFEQIVNDTDHFGLNNINRFDPQIRESLKKENIYLLVYYGDSLKYWSDNHISVDSCLGDIRTGNSIISTRNGYFQIYKKAGYHNYLCLYQIKSEYQIQNKYISNRLNPDFNIDADVDISLKPMAGYEQITDHKGNYFFSISIVNSKKNYPWLLKILELLLIALLLIIFEAFASKAIANKALTVLISGSIIFLLLARIIPVSFQIPKFIYDLPIFDPIIYANNSIFSSLGDYLLNIVLLCRVLYLILSYLFRNKPYPGKHEDLRCALFFLLKITIASLVVSGIVSLVMDSSISADLSKQNLNGYTAILFCAICITTAVYLLFSDIFNISQNNKLNFSTRFLLSILLLAGGFVFLKLIFGFSSIYAFCILFLVLLFDWVFYTKRFNRTQKTSFITPVLAAILVSFLIYDNNIRKENELKKLIAESIINNSDYRIEQILPEIDKKIKNDVKINEYSYNTDLLEKHLRTRYFTGYLNKYSLSLISNDSADRFKLLSIDTLYGEQTYKLNKTNFVKTNIISPITGYIGKFFLDSGYIYIILQSKNFDSENGLYEVFSEINYSKDNNPDNYSWAIYKHGKLINTRGTYNYPLIFNRIGKSLLDGENTNIDDWIHTLYSEKNDIRIILSKEAESWSKPISYVGFFITFYILFFLATIVIVIFIVFLKNIHYWFSDRTKFVVHYTGSLKNDYISGGLNLSLMSVRIQLTIGSVILLTLLVTIFVNQTNNTEIYNKNQTQKLNLKLREVKTEAEKFIKLKSGYIQTEFLEEYLTPITEIYQTDLNIFDAGGNLIYSSQPRIFESGIISSKINESAIKSIYIDSNSQFIQNEHLGKLEYLSAYAPLFINDQFIGSINLPYFTKQAELTEAIKTNLISLITPYTFIFIVIGILAWLITSSFVRRLNIIREKISTTVLGKKNPKIKWHTRDEIGDLVKQYNIMVDKLAQSADTLAQNERNEAWREMAKQIAHEIKNPLTPMKLNLQQLQKAYRDNHPMKEEIMSKVSRVLVEQIDALANLATEFSNFAKMPESKHELIDICALIEDIKTLFPSDDSISIKLTQNTDNLYIKADANEIKRVFTNLLKNAIQAIPEGRKGLIEIVTYYLDKHNQVLITIRDNGEGIEDQLKDKIFVPNFSTKNSGMGLGLAMVKKIVEHSGGYIRFESEPGVGTIFFVELPLTELS